MKRKWILFAVMSMVMLVVFYALSLRISLSYQNTVKAEAQLVQELSSTDLSSVSINGYKLGEKIRIVPNEGWEEDKIPSINLSLEDDTRISLRDIYYTGKIVDSRLKSMAAYDLKKGITVSYNGEVVRDPTSLQDFLGDSYIEILKTGYESHLIIYIDHENNLILTLGTSISGSENAFIDMNEFKLNDYVNYQPDSSTSIWWTGSNPFFVIPNILQKLNYNYTIFQYRNYGFTKSELLILPIYYYVLFLPVLALIVFRRKKLLYLNVALAVIYILWSVATVMYFAQF